MCWGLFADVQLKNSSESQDMLRPGKKQGKEGEAFASYMVCYR
jgi:hypothetical protein